VDDPISNFDFSAVDPNENLDDLWETNFATSSPKPKPAPNATVAPMSKPPLAPTKTTIKYNNGIHQQQPGSEEPPRKAVPTPAIVEKRKPFENIDDDEELIRRRKARKAEEKKLNVEDIFNQFDSMMQEDDDLPVRRAPPPRKLVTAPRLPHFPSVTDTQNKSAVTSVTAADNGTKQEYELTREDQVDILAERPEEVKKRALEKWSQFAQVKELHPALRDKVIGTGGSYRHGSN
jgi:hypothetical protein